MSSKKTPGRGRKTQSTAFPGTLERNVQNLILHYLRLRGWKVVITDAGAVARATRGELKRSPMRPGTPDLHAMIGRNGRIYGIAVETKRPRGGRLSPAQIFEHREYAACGVTVIVANSYESFVEQYNKMYSFLSQQPEESAPPSVNG